jgi:Pyridoxamine 5'-phosphate oxidase
MYLARDSDNNFSGSELILILLRPVPILVLEIRSTPMDKSTIHSFLLQHRYAVISSLSANNTPQSALIGIAVSANLEIIFDTLKSSRKYPNLIANPNCSLVIGW